MTKMCQSCKVGDFFCSTILWTWWTNLRFKWGLKWWIRLNSLLKELKRIGLITDWWSNCWNYYDESSSKGSMFVFGGLLSFWHDSSSSKCWNLERKTCFLHFWLSKFSIICWYRRWWTISAKFDESSLI